LEHRGVPKKEAAVKTVRALKEWHGDWQCSCRVLLIAAEMDPGRWWVLEETGCCLQRSRKVRPITDVTSAALRKAEMVVHLFVFKVVTQQQLYTLQYITSTT
jgi:hypothetical protein